MKLGPQIAAVVTGGSSGLGEAAARAIAATGARVAIFDLDATRGKHVAQDIGGLFVSVDVGDDASVAAGLARARAQHGVERVLVTCAGVPSAAKTVVRDKATGTATGHSMADFTRVININLLGTLRCISQSAVAMADLEPLADDERGAIVCISSVAAEDGQVGQVAYAASKAGVAGMTLPVARDLMNEGIRINSILPGTFATPMLTGLSKRVRDALAAGVTFPRRPGDPCEFAALVLLLIEQAYMNASRVRIDGGLRAAGR